MPLYVRMLWITASPDGISSAMEQHREHLRELEARGRLRAAGAFTRDDGFLEIFAAKDLHEAEAIVHASPLVEGGLCSWQLREWIELEL
jgi:uncharacterized protein YciI